MNYVEARCSVIRGASRQTSADGKPPQRFCVASLSTLTGNTDVPEVCRRSPPVGARNDGTRSAKQESEGAEVSTPPYIFDQLTRAASARDNESGRIGTREGV